MNIRVDLNAPIKDGAEVIFRSPVDCSQVAGLKVYYPEEGQTASREFMLADAHGNNVGDIDHLFAENVVVKVILDCTTGMAFVQNADTNAYLEKRFDEIEKELQNIGTPENEAPGGNSSSGVDYIVEQQHSNTAGVCYRKWASGFVELWVDTLASATASVIKIALPFVLGSTPHYGRPMIHCANYMIGDEVFAVANVYIEEAYNESENRFYSNLCFTIRSGTAQTSDMVVITAYITGFWK